MAEAGISKRAPLGKRFGRVIVTSPSFKSPTSEASMVECRCVCGDVRAYFIGNLVKQKEPMCPECRNKSRPSKGQGLKHPLFNIWKAMIQRCENPNHTHYDKYGGRGIRICDHWRGDFEAFAEDVGDRPSHLHTIDRIDNDGDYEPGNVRWATPRQQAVNRRKTIIVEWGGRRLTVRQAARIAGVSYPSLSWRLRSGWSIRRAMTTPMRIVSTQTVERELERREKGNG